MTSIRVFVRRFWSASIKDTNATDVSVEVVVTAILKDEELTKQAVFYAVNDIRKNDVDRHARQRLTKTGNARPSPLADALIEHGLSLMNTRFGRKPLGNYLPDELNKYVAQQRESGQTTLIRASFLAAVVVACEYDELRVRDQLSERALEAIRLRLITVCPAPELAE